MKSLFYKTISCVGLLSILVSLFTVAQVLVTSGYEISIYEVFPFYFWILLIIAMSSGIFIIVNSLKENEKSNWWILGLFLIIYVNLILFLLPIFRGYYTYGRGDVLAHIGYIKDIIQFGTFAGAGNIDENLYPIIHIISTSIYYFTGISPELIVQFIPVLFYIFYIISIYLLSKELTGNLKASVLTTTLGSILIFRFDGNAFIPSTLLFFLMPFLLFLFYRSRGTSSHLYIYRSLLLLLLVTVPFFHPGEGTIILISFFVLIELSLFVYKNIIKDYISHNFPQKTDFRDYSINLPLILATLWFVWFASSSLFFQKTREIASWLSYQTGRTDAITYSNILNSANLSLYQIIDFLVKFLGQDILYLSLSTIFCVIVLKKLLKREVIKVEEFTFLMLFISFSILLLLTFTNWFGFDYTRELKYLLFVSTIFSGIILYKLIEVGNNFKKSTMLILCCFLIVSGTIGIFNSFSSPLVRGPNFQVTTMEISGSTWYVENRDKKLTTQSINNLYPGQVRLFIESKYGVDFLKKNSFVIYSSPDHFGYYKNDNYGESLNKSAYFLNFKLQRIAYDQIYPDLSNKWRFTSSDFEKLDNNDYTASEIYSNGEFWVYLVNPKKNDNNR